MPYTFVPKEEHAKAFGDNLGVSTKNAVIVCRSINNKKLTVAKRLLENLISKQQSLKGMYYTNASKEILMLLESCEKNAEFMGLETSRLFVHAGATHGALRRRKRRKSGFGSAMKLTNVEIMLIQKGKETAKKTKEHKNAAASSGHDKKETTHDDKKTAEEKTAMKKKE